MTTVGKTIGNPDKVEIRELPLPLDLAYGSICNDRIGVLPCAIPQ